MSVKHYVGVVVFAISALVVSRFLSGGYVDEGRAQKHVVLIESEIATILGQGAGNNIVGRLVKPGGTWITASLPSHGFGPDAYRDLGKRMEMHGWVALPNESWVYCKDGATATFKTIQNIDDKSSAVAVSFEFSGSSLLRCDKQKN